MERMKKWLKLHHNVDELCEDEFLKLADEMAIASSRPLMG